MSVDQAAANRANAAFWNELCGTSMARSLGITGAEPDALKRFDTAYFDFYPYLKDYVDRYDLRGAGVLEIGLGYGTLGQYIAERGADYYGIDIASTPVEMMRHRLRMLGRPNDHRIVQGSALELPFADRTFDYVYSIGCLHHTGDLQRGVDDVWRVLKSGGTAILMLYNRYSARQLWRIDRRRLTGALRGRGRPSAEQIRGLYDVNTSLEAAPHTDFTSRKDARRLLRRFSRVQIEAKNFDNATFRGRRLFAREQLLRTPLPRVLGLDLYIVATK